MGKQRGGVRVKQVGPKAPAMPMNPMEALQIPPTEMIQLPAPVDRSYQVFWPMQETFSMDTAGFQVIYPSYLDSNKTVKEGRRLPSSLAVPMPTVSDISLALQKLQVRHVLQPYKGYSRDCQTLWDNPGRVKVSVSQYNKKELLRLVAAAVPLIPERIQRVERETIEAEASKQKLLAEKEELAKSTTPKKAITGGVAGKNNKKGKKGKKK
jgi:signal recognition particle subunit SRP19